jgi:hypothetical protein
MICYVSVFTFNWKFLGQYPIIFYSDRAKINSQIDFIINEYIDIKKYNDIHSLVHIEHADDIDKLTIEAKKYYETHSPDSVTCDGIKINANVDPIEL